MRQKRERRANGRSAQTVRPKADSALGGVGGSKSRGKISTTAAIVALAAGMTMFATTPAWVREGAAYRLVEAAQRKNDSTDYRLGAKDRVRIKALEWRAARDEIYEWKAVNGDYAIGPAGKMQLPMLGEVDASGMTPAELANTIAVRLKTELDLSAAPDVTVEVVNFRPFYITGLVQKPGEYEYRPELTVLQAVSVAGGYFRRDELAAVRMEQELVSAKGNVRVLDNELITLLARKARLDAELTGSETTSFPEILKQRELDQAVAVLLDQERVYFQTRRNAYDSQTQALEALRKFLEEESASLNARMVTHARQLDLVQKELENINTLYKQGLATSPRRLALEQNAAQLEGERIRLNTELAKSRQEISKTTIQLLELRNQRTREITSDALATHSRLNEIAQKSATAVELMNWSATQARSLFQLANLGSDSGQSFVVRITRKVRGKVVELDATETTAIEPGDSIKIDVRGQPAARSFEEVKVPIMPETDTLRAARLD